MIDRIINQIKKLTRQSPDKAIREWTNNIVIPPSVKGNILITALRNGTWIEWAVYSAFVLRQMGYNSTLLYRSGEVQNLYAGQSFWDIVSRTPFIRLVDIDSFAPDKEIIDRYKNETPAFLFDAVAYNHHVERADIISDPKEYLPSVKELILESAQAYHAAINEFSQTHYHRFICYSGLIQVTPTLLQAAVEAGVETACIEGWAWRAGHVIYNFNKPALAYNLRGWMNYYGWGPDQHKAIDEYLAFQDGKQSEKALWLKGFYNVQQSKVNTEVSERIHNFLEQHNDSFLLAPNVVGDSSTLNKETIFSSMKEWVKEVITFFRQHPQYSLIIRAHPAEVWAKSKVTTRFGELAEELSQGCENILVIKGEEKVNTFYLLPSVKCGLVWVSSVGVDLVVRNIPVICAASPQYGKLGFVNLPQSKDEYFKLLRQYADASHTSTTEAEKLEAKKYLYVVFKGFSFPAQGSDFSARTLKLNHMPHQAEHDRLYQILVGSTERPDAVD